jgi:antitoxin VapB
MTYWFIPDVPQSRCCYTYVVVAQLRLAGVTPMKTAEVVETNQGQAVRLPTEFRFESSMVAIRREGEAVILEPVKPSTWPKGFFEQIRIDDPCFARPDQGDAPPAPALD